jgi:signal transduction histidine kinase
MDADLERILNAEEEKEGQISSHLSSAGYYRYIGRRIVGHLFDRLKADTIKLYCTGFEPASFALLASMPTDHGRSTISTIDTEVQSVNALHGMPIEDDPAKGMRPFEFVSNGILRIWLYARGEYFGYMQIAKSSGFSPSDVSFVNNNAGGLVRFLAEENFSFRMHILLESFESHEVLSADDDKFYDLIVKKVVLGFGADGATLRLFDSDQNTLNIKARIGHTTGVVSDERHVGEMLSGKLFDDSDRDFGAIVIKRPSLDLGATITTVERARFSAAGVTAVVVGKLMRKDSLGKSHNFGTLSYFFKRPHRYSRRDLDLFRGFCKRVSDGIFIAQTLGELQAQAAILEAQSRRMTYVEVTNLLAHDLWHKSFNSVSAAQENNDLVRALIRDSRIRASDKIIDEIKASAQSAHDLADAVHSTSSNLHSLQIRPNAESYKPELFGLLDVVNGVEKTLRPALSRQKITVRKSISDTHKIYGPRLAFEQVIFNLMINSIDAARGRPATRPMGIDLHSHIEGDRLIIRYSDEGPGIDPVRFPNMQDIFKIGETSKAEGTGTGLPVARQLIGTHFSGQLLLDKRQRRPPQFTIDVPFGISD